MNHSGLSCDAEMHAKQYCITYSCQVAVLSCSKALCAISDNTKTLYILESDKSWVILGSTVCACMHISEKQHGTEILIAGSLGRREVINILLKSLNPTNDPCRRKSLCDVQA